MTNSLDSKREKSQYTKSIICSCGCMMPDSPIGWSLVYWQHRKCKSQHKGRYYFIDIEDEW